MGAVLVGLLVGCGGNTPTPTVENNALPESASALRFTTVTAGTGLGDFKHVNGAFGKLWFPEIVGGGAGFMDYDGDGWEDLVLVQGGTWAESPHPPVSALALYRNQGDGSFTEVTDLVGLEEVVAYGMGVALADYDNDGDPDIFLSTVDRNLLFRNEATADGQPRFVEVGLAAGLTDIAEWSTSALFFDADLDGYLDLYVGNYVDWSPEKDIVCTIVENKKSYCTPQLYEGTAGRFYHNNGDGTFSDWTVEAGFADAPGKTLGVAEWDFNQDGWSDIVVANDTQRDLLYLNQGDGTFVERGVASGLAFDENGKARAGMGIDIGILDETGQPSVLVGHFHNEMMGVYRQVGDALFVDRSAPAQIGRASMATVTFGLCLFDADLDGDLDVFATNGHISEDVELVMGNAPFRQLPHLFLNEGEGRFSESTLSLTPPVVGRGVATADYDRDGDVDLLVTENDGPVYLVRNELEEGQAVRVALQGTTANRDALGAQVEAVVGARRMHQRVRNGSSYLASSEKTLTFGLGTASQIDTLIVHWPGGGVDRYTALPAQHEVLISQGEGILAHHPLEKGEAMRE